MLELGDVRGVLGGGGGLGGGAGAGVGGGGGGGSNVIRNELNQMLDSTSRNVIRNELNQMLDSPSGRWETMQKDIDVWHAAQVGLSGSRSAVPAASANTVHTRFRELNSTASYDVASMRHLALLTTVWTLSCELNGITQRSEHL
jgi:hypothetical protein